MSTERRRTRPPWLKSHAESFGPIKHVGVAVSIGFPLLVIGVLMLSLLIVRWVGVSTSLWAIAIGLVVAGLLAARSRRVI